MTEDEKIIHEYATKLFMESFQATLDAGMLKKYENDEEFIRIGIEDTKRKIIMDYLREQGDI